MVGLLALGEWGPAIGAISGLISSEQARQQSIASGTVVESVVQVVSGGGWGDGDWIPLGRLGEWRQWRPTGRAISGSVRTQQARQQSLAVGTVVAPVEIPVITVVRTSEARQEITIIGDMIDDDELAALTALLMAAD